MLLQPWTVILAQSKTCNTGSASSSRGYRNGNSCNVGSPNNKFRVSFLTFYGFHVAGINREEVFLHFLEHWLSVKLDRPRGGLRRNPDRSHRMRFAFTPFNSLSIWALQGAGVCSVFFCTLKQCSTFYCQRDTESLFPIIPLTCNRQ